MRNWLRAVEELLWPRGLKCLCCDELSEGELLCPTCRKALEAMRLPQDEAGNNGGFSVFQYEGVAKMLIQMLKFDCLSDAATPLAAEMAKKIADMQLPADTVLTWVTMPELRRRKRGIDHGRILCEAVGQASGLPVRKLLSRRGNLHTQRGLDKVARQRNLQGSLLCREEISVSVLVIDDVMTTGATASVCAEALLAAGAHQVFVLTATRVTLKQ